MSPTNKAIRIKKVACRLCIALIMALLIVPGFIVAPLLFAKAGSVTLAGMLAGSMFHIVHPAALMLSIAVAMFWRGAIQGRWRWSLLAIIIICLGVDITAITPQMTAIKNALLVTGLDSGADSVMRHSFGMWHGISQSLHALASLAALALVGIGEQNNA
ncbi:MAG: DUF4149 domain-containing protein [Mariprofundales bacterium]